MSRRFLALWLPYFATDRLGPTAAPTAGPSTDPLVTLAEQAGVPRVMAANRPAAALGITLGMALADARALYPALATREANPLREHRSLTRLADWCDRYSPLIALDGADGLMLDITGCDHLFGGEAAMLADLTARMEGFGYSAAAAIAPTPGAAWALSRFAASGTIAGDMATLPGLLAPLPLAALRLSADCVTRLAQVGLRRTGDLLAMPRAPLARRFGAQVGQRLAQALGQMAEAIAPRHAPAPYRLRLDWMEPLRRVEDLTAAAGHLLDQLCQRLEEDERGVRHLTVTCHGTDGHVHRAEIRTSAPSRRPTRLSRLLEADLGSCDMGFGIETMILSAPQTEKLQAAASNFWLHQAGMAEDTAALIDRLSQRFGERRVGWPRPVASYLPERASAFLPALHHPPAGVGEAAPPAYSHAACPPRPLRLLPKPEPVQATALLPDHPPAAFRWRKVGHRVRQGGGPERIAPEWWRDLPADGLEAGSGAALDGNTRDYYLVEDQAGQRFWLYRQGLYDRPKQQAAEPDAATPPAWFLQGVMA
jgi:protein ImuB